MVSNLIQPAVHLNGCIASLGITPSWSKILFD